MAQHITKNGSGYFVSKTAAMIIPIIGILFGAGSAVGVMKIKIDTNRDKIEEMKVELKRVTDKEEKFNAEIKTMMGNIEVYMGRVDERLKALENGR